MTEPTKTPARSLPLPLAAAYQKAVVLKAQAQATINRLRSYPDPDPKILAAALEDFTRLCIAEQKANLALAAALPKPERTSDEDAADHLFE